MSEVKLYLIKSKDTWIELSCEMDLDKKCLVCSDGKEYPLQCLKKVIKKYESKRLFGKKKSEIITYYIQIMKSPTTALDINEKGEYSELEDTTVLENAIATGLQRAMEKPPIWWQWIMLFAIGVLGGTGLGAFLSQLWLKCPTVQIVKP